MAEGDEKIDHNDRVLVLSRMTDERDAKGELLPGAKVEVQFNGPIIMWTPGQVRSIQRDEAEHFIRHSRVRVDPTGENPGVYKLVIVDEARQPVTEGDSAEPLTIAYCKKLAEHGFIDATHLAPDRQFGADNSMQLIDPETGQHPTKTELRGAPKDGSDMRPYSPGPSPKVNLDTVPA
jgi:hypothetical protein